MPYIFEQRKFIHRRVCHVTLSDNMPATTTMQPRWFLYRWRCNQIKCNQQLKKFPFLRMPNNNNNNNTTANNANNNSIVHRCVVPTSTTTLIIIWIRLNEREIWKYLENNVFRHWLEWWMDGLSDGWMGGAMDGIKNWKNNVELRWERLGHRNLCGVVFILNWSDRSTDSLSLFLFHTTAINAKTWRMLDLYRINFDWTNVIIVMLWKVLL